jgi:hypothetical protein
MARITARLRPQRTCPRRSRNGASDLIRSGLARTMAASAAASACVGGVRYLETFPDGHVPVQAPADRVGLAAATPDCASTEVRERRDAVLKPGSISAPPPNRWPSAAQRLVWPSPFPACLAPRCACGAPIRRKGEQLQVIDACHPRVSPKQGGGGGATCEEGINRAPARIIALNIGTRDHSSDGGFSSIYCHGKASARQVRAFPRHHVSTSQRVRADMRGIFKRLGD